MAGLAFEAELHAGDRLGLTQTEGAHVDAIAGDASNAASSQVEGGEQ